MSSLFWRQVARSNKFNVYLFIKTRLYDHYWLQRRLGTNLKFATDSLLLFFLSFFLQSRRLSRVGTWASKRCRRVNKSEIINNFISRQMKNRKFHIFNWIKIFSFLYPQLQWIIEERKKNIFFSLSWKNCFVCFY